MSETFQSENIHEISYEQQVFQKTSISLFIAAFIEICIFRCMTNIHFQQKEIF